MEKESTMKKFLALALVAATLGGCAGMSRQEQNTYVGAVIGSIFWVPGAAIGGYIGHNMR